MKLSNYKHLQRIYVYDSIQLIKSYSEKRIVSIGELLNDYNGLTIFYSLEKIKEKVKKENIDFIDISSLVEIVNFRSDMILQVEILFFKLAKFYDGNYCLRSDCAFILDEKVPFIFKKTIPLEEQKERLEAEMDEIDVKSISEIVDNINSELIGHDIFKNDFKKNLLKYSFLNNMGNRKILSILICGESGIGKTEFAKIVSKKMYPNEDLIKINFGNYSTEGVLNSLIGAPLGYKGCEEGGELINKIKKSKSKVILIDEFEKATPSIYNFFYELLEDGVFTDRHGNRHDLNGYIIIFTSNMTQEIYQEHIPNSLRSRFDMVYYFENLQYDEKNYYIQKNAKKLINELEQNYGKKVNYKNIESELARLVVYENLRDIKRKIEDIVFDEFFPKYF
mgnify:FL=1